MNRQSFTVSGFWSVAAVARYVARRELEVPAANILMKSVAVISFLVEASSLDDAKGVAEERVRQAHPEADDYGVVVEPISTQTVKYMAEVV